MEAGYGVILRELRLAAGLTQRELAARIGCTDGFLAFAELERRTPSPEFAKRLLDVLDVSDADRERLLGALMAARQKQREEKEQARYAALTGALRARGPASQPEDAPQSSQAVPVEETEEDWQQACRYLRIALANPETRPAVLATLKVFAQSALRKAE